MAHPSGLSLWAFLNREKLRLTATEFTWPRQLNCPWRDTEVRIILGDHSFIGRGTAFEAETAFDIAVSEAMERGVYHSLGERKSGYAGFSAHRDLEQAADSASCELLERDAFFCHYLTQTPFLKRVDLSLLADELGKLPFYLAQHRVQVESRMMCVPAGFSSVITVALGQQASRPFGVFVGLGCKRDISDSGENLKSALRSSLFECLRNLTAWLENESDPAMAYGEFTRRPDPSPADHNALAKNVAQCGGLLTLLALPQETFSQRSELNPLDRCKIRIDEIPSHAQLPQGLPLVFTGASHEECIRTYFGPFKALPRELRRLSRFLSRPVGEDAVFTKPHPIG